MESEIFSCLTTGIRFKAPTTSEKLLTSEVDNAQVIQQAKTDDSNRSNSAAVKGYAAVRTRDPFEEANVVRKRHRIRVSGSQPPQPLQAFSELVRAYGCPDWLLERLNTEGFIEPTAIQRQSIPALLQGREIMAIAPTGSGKTASFVIPMILTATRAKAANQQQQQDNQRQSSHQHASISTLCLSPTRELNAQTSRVFKRLSEGSSLNICHLTKPESVRNDFSQFDVMLSTPLLLQRLVDKDRCPFSRVQLLVMDEADRMFEMGMVAQVDGVMAACTNKKLVRAFFSATLCERVEQLARGVMKDPLRITVGERDSAANSVRQQLLFVGQEKGKLLALRQLMSGGIKPPVLVFVATKDRAKEVHRELLYSGLHVDSIHSDQPPAQRQAAVDNFRSGKCCMLITTDLLGRGMDFVGVKTVVNYDIPRSRADYIHRIGRTGRAGNKGEAITFFLEDDAPQLRAIANVIIAAGGEVPQWMLALQKPRKQRAKRKQKNMLLRETDENEDGCGEQQKKAKLKPERPKNDAKLEGKQGKSKQTGKQKVKQWSPGKSNEANKGETGV